MRISMPTYNETYIASKTNAAFALKGGLFTLTTIDLLDVELDNFGKQLVDKIKQAPNFFKNAPIVIGLKSVSEIEKPIDFQKLKEILLTNKLFIVGVKNGSNNQHQLAIQAGIAVLRDTSKPKTLENINQPSAPKSADKYIEQNASFVSNLDNDAQHHKATKLITEPIRSGQQICAPDGDLVIVAQVSPGAEVLAHGNIHIYGSLKGRALAGINGDEQARIFCSSLEAELISIAGQYRISEDLGSDVWKKPANISIQEGRLQISKL